MFVLLFLRVYGEEMFSFESEGIEDAFECARDPEMCCVLRESVC